LTGFVQFGSFDEDRSNRFDRFDRFFDDGFGSGATTSRSRTAAPIST